MTERFKLTNLDVGELKYYGECSREQRVMLSNGYIVEFTLCAGDSICVYETKVVIKPSNGTEKVMMGKLHGEDNVGLTYDGPPSFLSDKDPDLLANGDTLDAQTFGPLE